MPVVSLAPVPLVFGISGRLCLAAASVFDRSVGGGCTVRSVLLKKPTKTFGWGIWEMGGVQGDFFSILRCFYTLKGGVGVGAEGV